jgi:hypothetical protein
VDRELPRVESTGFLDYHYYLGYNSYLGNPSRAHTWLVLRDDVIIQPVIRQTPHHAHAKITDLRDDYDDTDAARKGQSSD